MKVFRGDSCREGFEPYNVTITIESFKEQELLRGLTQANSSVPAAVASYKENGDLRAPMVKFLKDLQNALKRIYD